MKAVKNIFVFVICLALLAVTGCTTTEKFSYDTWNKNSDDAINKDEFTEVFKSHYAVEWEEEREMADSPYNSKEFLQSSYAFWDADDNDYIDENEWDSLNEFYFNKYGFEKFSTIDEDNNGQINYTEYIAHVEDNGLFSGWDENGDDVVNESELAQGIFKSYDYDNSGYLEMGEFNTFTSYYAER